MDDVSALLAMFKRKDEEINRLLKEIEEATCEYEESLDLNLKKTVAMEFKMFRLRALVTNDYIKIKQILNDSTTLPTSVSVSFKKRETYLTSVINRINEMRADFEVIQRGCYYTKIKSSIQ